MAEIDYRIRSFSKLLICFASEFVYRQECHMYIPLIYFCFVSSFSCSASSAPASTLDEECSDMTPFVEVRTAKILALLAVIFVLVDPF